ncbi:MAG: IS982 family transposase [Gallionella sp.]|nr:IS982 family transposase [Gallionella sp.]MDD4965195.1 IS982 family transposase [Gallionella sp.]
MILHKLFCDIDDFCAVFIPEWQRTRLLNGRCKRNTPKMLCESEIITIVVLYQTSGYRTLKWFYTKHLAQNLKGEFPNLPSYNRFVELMSEILEPLAAFMQSRCGQSRGIAFVDSTPLRVCENIRIPRHKTFKEQAGRAKSSTGWFYGFKLHFMVNDCGEILSFCLTRGNVDDHTPVPKLAKRLIGKLFGDRGYVSQKLTELLAKQNVELITTLKKNMKPKVIVAFDKLILRKRSIIETINDQLKNTFNLEHSRHRSLRNFVVNAIACLVAYSYQKKKPSLNINHADLLPFVQ